MQETGVRALVQDLELVNCNKRSYCNENPEHCTGEAARGNQEHCTGEAARGDGEQCTGEAARRNQEHCTGEAARGNKEHCSGKSLHAGTGSTALGGGCTREPGALHWGGCTREPPAQPNLIKTLRALPRSQAKAERLSNICNRVAPKENL